MKNITLICGSEERIRYFCDNIVIASTKDLLDLTPEILKTEMRYLTNRKGRIVKYGKTHAWEKIYPMRHIHWWYGEISPVRVYIINVSLRSGVGTHSKRRRMMMMMMRKKI